MCLRPMTKEERVNHEAYLASPDCHCGSPKYVRRDGKRDYTCQLCFIREFTYRFATEVPYECHSTKTLRSAVLLYLERMTKCLDLPHLDREFEKEVKEIFKAYDDSESKV